MSWGPGRRGLNDLRQGGRPSSSVSEGICHFNDVIFLARLLSAAAPRGQLPPRVRRQRRLLSDSLGRPGWGRGQGLDATAGAGWGGGVSGPHAASPPAQPCCSLL